MAKRATKRVGSERNAALEALRESEEWLSITIRSIGDAVIATDANGRVTFLNPFRALKRLRTIMEKGAS